MRRFLLPAALVAVTLTAAAPAVAKDPVPLVPFEWPGGFSPHGPQPIPATHPLYRRVAIDPVLDMPNRVGSTFVLVARSKEMAAALRATLEGAQMLAPDGTKPFAVLSVRWVQFELPFKIGFSSTAKATLRYELKRVDNGQVIFRRDVATTTTARGGDGVERARSAGRATLLANIAGATWCLDKAAFGQAPVDCSVETLGSITSTERTMVYVPPIPRR